MIDSHRCNAVVYRRDTLRYTGGPRRYTMHYQRGRCSRRPKDGQYCAQHAAMARQWGKNFIGEWTTP